MEHVMDPGLQKEIMAIIMVTTIVPEITVRHQEHVMDQDQMGILAKSN
jgi:hypothetical protein